MGVLFFLVYCILYSGIIASRLYFIHTEDMWIVLKKMWNTYWNSCAWIPKRRIIDISLNWSHEDMVMSTNSTSIQIKCLRLISQVSKNNLIDCAIFHFPFIFTEFVEAPSFSSFLWSITSRVQSFFISDSTNFSLSLWTYHRINRYASQYSKHKYVDWKLLNNAVSIQKKAQKE